VKLVTGRRITQRIAGHWALQAQILLRLITTTLPSMHDVHLRLDANHASLAGGNTPHAVPWADHHSPDMPAA
jgi:hypothetical protein